MRKILAMLLMLAMVAAVAAPTFAADINAGGGSGTGTGNGSGSYDLGVNGEFQPATAPSTVISVDIQWTEMKFTYNVGSKGTWNSTTHTYENPITAGWATGEKATITVVNHSNCTIDADFKFTSTDSGISGVFTSSTLNIASADDDTYRQTTNEGVLSAPSGTTDFSIDPTSDPITATGALGTITIGIKKGTPKRTVGTEAELNAAIAALKTTGGTITLSFTGDELTLTNPIEIPAGTGTSTSPLIIDLGGKTVIGRIAIGGTSTSRSYVTLRNGDVSYRVDPTDTILRDDPAQAAVYARYTDLKLDELEINSWQLALITSTGTKTLVENICNLTGNFPSGRFLWIAVYNISSEDFVMSGTDEGTIEFHGYIISNYSVTLKANGSYIFFCDNGDVFFMDLESDTTIDGSRSYPAVDGAYPNEYVILPTSAVDTE